MPADAPQRRLETHCEAVLAHDVAQAVVGAGRPLEPIGLDARISLARLYLDQERDEKAAEQLELVQKDDPGYRADEVLALLIEAGVVDPTSEGQPDEVDPAGDADAASDGE